MTNEQLELVQAAGKRALELMDATQRFMRVNPIAAEYSVTYDEAQCDGNCLANDCIVAYDELTAALAALPTAEAVEREAREAAASQWFADQNVESVTVRYAQPDGCYPTWTIKLVWRAPVTRCSFLEAVEAAQAVPRG